MGAMTIKEYFPFPKAPALLELHYHYLVSYTEHLLRESYSSAEMPSVYSAALVNWANYLTDQYW